MDRTTLLAQSPTATGEDAPHSGRLALSALREREKELDFVYALAALLNGRDLDEHRAACRTAGLFRAALEHPALAIVRIVVLGCTAQDPDDSLLDGANGWSLQVAHDGELPCSLAAGYGKNGLAFSAREQALAESTVRLLAIAAERIVAQRRETAFRTDLERKNIALSELLSRIEDEKRQLREALLCGIQARLEPVLSRLQRWLASAACPSPADSAESAHPADPANPADPAHPANPAVGQLLEDLRLVSSIWLTGEQRSNQDLLRLLSQRERQVCELAATGYSSKEIALRLGVAVATVERHRHNARRKFGMPPRIGSLAEFIHPR